jgi:hypothetical protein
MKPSAHSQKVLIKFVNLQINYPSRYAVPFEVKSLSEKRKRLGWLKLYEMQASIISALSCPYLAYLNAKKK